MKLKKISIKEFMIGGGFLWGGGTFLAGLANPAAPSLGSVPGLTVLALVGGALGAGFVACIYNYCVFIRK